MEKGLSWVEPDVKLPAYWGKFLKVDANNTELFHYLAEQSQLIKCAGKNHFINLS